MKVIVASMSKCGTKTLHKCLEILGYSVADFDFHGFDHREEWKSILLNGSREGQFYEMYKDIDAVCDLPPAYYWEEIAAAFPDAKIILTTRKSEAEWAQSHIKQMARHAASWMIRLGFLLTPTGWQYQEHFRRIGRVVFGCPPQGLSQTLHQPNEEILKRRYREHNAGVISRCGENKLLHFNFSDGWEPLCLFLNKDIPDKPFPHENKKGQLTESLWDLPGFHRMKTELVLIFGVMITFLCFCIQWSLSYL